MRQMDFSFLRYWSHQYTMVSSYGCLQWERKKKKEYKDINRTKI